MKKEKNIVNESITMKLTIYGGSFAVLSLVLLGLFFFLINIIEKQKAKSPTGRVAPFFSTCYWVIFTIMIAAAVAGITMLIIALVLHLKKSKKIRK